MEQLKRRDALKAASAAAVFTALTAVGSSRAQDPATEKSRDKHPKKAPRTTGQQQWFNGCVSSVGWGAHGEFTFGLKVSGVEEGFLIDDADANEAGTRIVLMAFEKGIPLWALGENLGHPHTYVALSVQIIR